MKWILLIGLVALVFVASSCSSMKKDCQGRRHERLKNGIYL